MFKKSTLFSFSGSLIFHLAFVLFAGDYILSSPPPPIVKKVYRLEIIKKKPPVEKKKIQKKKNLRRKIPKLLRPIKQPKIIMKQEPLLMAKVTPLTTPNVKPIQRQLRSNPVVSPVSSFSSAAITAKTIAVKSRKVQPVTNSISAISNPVSAFESSPNITASPFVNPQVVRSTFSSNNSLVKRASSWVSKRSLQVDLPQIIPQRMVSLDKEVRGQNKTTLVENRSTRVFSVSKSSPVIPKNFGSTDSKGTRTAYFEGAEKKVLMASINPRAVPNFTDDGALRSYKNGLGRTITRNKKYPKLSRVKHEEGKVIVKFFILRNGKMVNLDWVVKSPYERLNEEALDAVKRSAPFPVLPSEYPGKYLEIELPFKFRLN